MELEPSLSETNHLLSLNSTEFKDQVIDFSFDIVTVEDEKYISFSYYLMDESNLRVSSFGLYDFTDYMKSTNDDLFLKHIIDNEFNAFYLIGICTEQKPNSFSDFQLILNCHKSLINQ